MKFQIYLLSGKKLAKRANVIIAEEDGPVLLAVMVQDLRSRVSAGVAAGAYRLHPPPAVSSARSLLSEEAERGYPLSLKASRRAPLSLRRKELEK